MRTLQPRVYDDFINEAKTAITHAQRNSLRKLLNFKFKRSPRHNWGPKRIAMVEQMVSERAMEILD